MTTATAGEAKLERATRFYAATIGKKVTMAVSGVVLFGFVVGHMLGNLQVFQGKEHLNAYAEFLHSKPAMLWGVRAVMLTALVLHVLSGIYLSKRSSDARPVKYQVKKNLSSSLASRSMLVSGLLIFFFVFYHLSHLTFGGTHPKFIEDDVFHNVVVGFQMAPAAIAYVVAMLGLGVHLYHGVWSMFQTWGVSHPRYTPALRTFAAVAATILVLGNSSIPLAILTGLVGS